MEIQIQQKVEVVGKIDKIKVRVVGCGFACHALCPNLPSRSS